MGCGGLRRSARIRIRRFESSPGPRSNGHEIVLEQRIVDPDQPAGVRHVRGVDVLVLLELAPSHNQVPDLFEAYLRRSSPVALPDFLYALATSVARRWLVVE